jgi:glycosyltransferase involved in cell wall biosynthesis/tetratricopeptide (TPR) repeat protein
MLLSAALIVRDEARVLDGCLASIEDVVDEIVLVDTGSQDNSVDIAVNHGARVIHHEWSGDFAEARNIGLEAARGEWILYIDADERLTRADRYSMQELLHAAREVAFRLLLRPDSHSTPYREHRLWRNDPRIRFAGRIHEKVAPAIAAVSRLDRRPIGDCESLLEHLGYEGDQSHKHRRNLPLLRAQLEREPDNLFNRHHLARVLDGLGESEEALNVLIDAVELARRRARDPLGVLAFTDLVRARRDRGEDVAALLDEARERYPQNKLLWWVQAAALISARRYEEALSLLDKLVRVELSSLPDEDVAYDRRIFGEFAQEARGVCLVALGRHTQAVAAYEEALRENPDSTVYRTRLALARGRARPQLARRRSEGRRVGLERGTHRVILLTPIQPAASGNGLAMRTELFRLAAAHDVAVETVVVPVAGGTGAGAITVEPDPAVARAGLRSLLAEPAWRERLASAQALPHAVRVASPGLGEGVAQRLGTRSFDALHVSRAYLAPLGVALAERLQLKVRTLDLDDDDAAAFASVHHDRAEAAAYERLIGVFGGLYDGLCAASADNAEAIGARHHLPVAHLPNAVVIPTVPRRQPAAELRLLFVGNLTYRPNVEAVELLVHEILPRLQRRLGERPVCVTLVGQASPEVERLASPAVRVRGFVEDLGPLYAQADVVVAPLRTGAGTRIKLLEAFAHNVPVVATRAAAEGLAVIDGRHLLLCTDPTGLAAAVADLAADPTLGSSLAEQAGRLVRERYSHAAVIPQVRAFLSCAARSVAAGQALVSS